MILKNPTFHKIKILPYLNGSANDTIILLNETQYSIATGSDRGIVNHGGFDSKYLTGKDSLLVIFDDSFKIVHYNIEPTMISPGNYVDSNSRNLFNYLNYEYSFEDKSKHSRLAFYKYIFIEQDYVDAKD